MAILLTNKQSKMHNPQVYPDPMRGADASVTNQAPHKEQAGIDLLTHVAIAAMNGFISYGNQRGNDIKASFDLAEAFLEERETRLNKIK